MPKCLGCHQELRREIKIPEIPWKHENDRWIRIK
jgi:hypothetical protein